MIYFLITFPTHYKLPITDDKQNCIFLLISVKVFMDLILLEIYTSVNAVFIKCICTA